MAKYHVNPTTLEPGRCRANKSCPFGGPSEHFDTPEKARVFAEEKLAENMNTFAQKGDFTVDEEVLLGEYYDTPGRKATVVAVEKDMVQLKSYDDGETYWVPKEFINDPESSMYVGRKDARGEFLTQEQVFVGRAVIKAKELSDAFEKFSPEEKQLIDDAWSNSPDSEQVRKDVYSTTDDKRLQAVENAWAQITDHSRRNTNDWAAAEGVQEVILAELTKDKISSEQYYALTGRIFEASPTLRKIVD
jgi:hypothetical protein